MTTIEVVIPTQPDRLPFAREEEGEDSNNTANTKKDVIYHMITYESTLRDMINKKLLSAKDFPTSQTCPIFHCLSKFDNPRLKPYLAIFNKAAEQEQSLILRTLAKDKDYRRRGAAVFLIGHMKNPRKIISYLIPYINDKNVTVTNNAMRVLGYTMDKAKIYDIDLQPFFKILKSTSGVERNKALFVINTAINSPTNKKLVREQIGFILLDILRLKQLNNHNYAINILETISGKSYGEYDLVAWEKWVKSSQMSKTV